MSCLFCDIVNKKKPADIVCENENIVVFKDINPKAPVHLLIVPKKHISSVKEVEKEDKELLGELFLTARKVAEEKKLEGYKLLT